MFVQDSAEIWRQLERRFSVANGARKYQLSKGMYETKQQGRLIADYYTDLKCIWEELEALRDLPAITTLHEEVREFIDAMRKDEEEQKLFQFLNGLDDLYSTQRSHLLMLIPLPSVDTACGMLQQEESQKQILKPKEESEVFAMFGGRSDLNCTNCGKAGHTTEKCWGCKACRKPGHSYDKYWTIVVFLTREEKAQENREEKPLKNTTLTGSQGKVEING